MVLKYIFSTSLLVLLYACGGAEVKEGLPEKQALPDGEKLFVQNCASCHGCDGTLGMSGAKNLAESNMSFSEAQFVIEKGTENGMPRFKEILADKGEMDAVTEFVLTLQKGVHE